MRLKSVEGNASGVSGGAGAGGRKRGNMRKSKISAAMQVQISREAKHDLKTLPPYFEDVLSEKKSFELRINDRDFQVGDTFLLREYENGAYTGRWYTGVISYVLKNCKEFGLQDGYCIFGW